VEGGGAGVERDELNSEVGMRKSEKRQSCEGEKVELKAEVGMRKAENEEG
jgi:hypothetical protein